MERATSNKWTTQSRTRQQDNSTQIGTDPKPIVIDGTSAEDEVKLNVKDLQVTLTDLQMEKPKHKPGIAKRSKPLLGLRRQDGR